MVFRRGGLLPILSSFLFRWMQLAPIMSVVWIELYG
jgi:hypothetical protein